MKPQKTSFARIAYACLYSRDGLIAAFKGEAAFRQELVLFLILLPLLFILPFSAIIKMMLFSANCLVLITELLNSATEAVVDLVSPEHHALAKKAKDMGSAAVLIALLLCLCLWFTALYTTFFQ